MYYPILRARQFELIALRELTIEGILQGYILPILEPVKEKQSNLNLAATVFHEHRQSAYLIVNPIVGDAEGDTINFLDYIDDLENNPFIPSFYFHNNANYIERSITDYELNNCLLICQSNVNADNNEFRELVQMPAITAITVDDPGRNRALDRFLKSLEINYIRLDDLFEKQLRNSDFLDMEEHKFSEEHLYFEDENFNGFSDYTILPSEYSDGGSTPRAVVIHFTYLNGQDQIWIRHFTSDTNDSIANVQGKFAEAAAKAVRYCRENELTNSAIQELENYYDEEHYPGLGTIKKISIKNHLLVVQDYLGRR